MEEPNIERMDQWLDQALVQEHECARSEWAAMRGLPQRGLYPRDAAAGVRQSEGDAGRAGLTTDERAELKRLQREVVELKRANEILEKASAYFRRS